MNHHPVYLPDRYGKGVALTFFAEPTRLRIGIVSRSRLELTMISRSYPFKGERLHSEENKVVGNWKWYIF